MKKLSYFEPSCKIRFSQIYTGFKIKTLDQKIIV
jgi:hypothetical protein